MELKNSFSLKKEIGNSIRMAAIVMTGVFQEKYRQPKFIDNVGEDSLYLRLIKMVDDGQLGAVENCLWERIEQREADCFQLALNVYAYMNDKEDDFLIEHDFPRIEIRDGVQYITNQKYICNKKT